MNVDLRSHHVVIDGVCSPVWETGPSAAVEAVVFVHGNPGPAETFRPLLEQVGRFSRAVAPDMPGFGRADKSPTFDYSVDGYARHLAAVLETLGIRRIHLVGHDFGGVWALRWAATHPDQTLSVVLINIGVLQNYRWHFLARQWRRRWLGEAVMAAMSYTALKLILRLRARRRVPDEAVRTMWDNFGWPTRRVILRLYRATDVSSLFNELKAQLSQLVCPAMVVWGATDIFVSVAHAHQQLDVFPGAEVVLLPESGHFPQLDDPEAVASAIVPFLRAQCGRVSDHKLPPEDVDIAGP